MAHSYSIARRHETVRLSLRMRVTLWLPIGIAVALAFSCSPPRVDRPYYRPANTDTTPTAGNEANPDASAPAVDSPAAFAPEEHPAEHLRELTGPDSEYDIARRMVLTAIAEQRVTEAGTVRGGAVLLLHGWTRRKPPRQPFFVGDTPEELPQEEAWRTVKFLMTTPPPTVAAEPPESQPVTYELTAYTNIVLATIGAVLRITLPSTQPECYCLVAPGLPGAHIGYWAHPNAAAPEDPPDTPTPWTDPAEAFWITSETYPTEEDGETYGPFPGMLRLESPDKGATTVTLTFAGGFITPDHAGRLDVEFAEAWLPIPRFEPPAEAPPAETTTPTPDD